MKACQGGLWWYFMAMTLERERKMDPVISRKGCCGQKKKQCPKHLLLCKKKWAGLGFYCAGRKMQLLKRVYSLVDGGGSSSSLWQTSKSSIPFLDSGKKQCLSICLCRTYTNSHTLKNTCLLLFLTLFYYLYLFLCLLYLRVGYYYKVLLLCILTKIKMRGQFWTLLRSKRRSETKYQT